MSVPTRINSLQTYQIVLYSRALHPELFSLKARRVVRQGQYELEGWIMPGAHVLRFERAGLCAVELLTDQDRNLPASHVVTAFPCSGEHEYEHRFTKHGVTYMTSVQTETLSENLYESTYAELMDLARESQSLCYEWREGAAKSASILDIQRFSREVHVQAYHLQSGPGLVVRTQTIFEHA